jgi:purine-binding chemotaxis protein CheW
MKLEYLRMSMELTKREETKLVSFAVEDVSYGIDIMSVREVINPSPLVRVPTLPEFVLGVVDHREDVVPVLDLRQRFGLTPAKRTKRTKWIILQLQNRVVGLEVDRVVQVVTVDRSMKKEQIQISEDDKPWIKNVYRTPELLVFELNLEVVVETNRLELDPKAVREPAQ